MPPRGRRHETPTGLRRSSTGASARPCSPARARASLVPMRDYGRERDPARGRRRARREPPRLDRRPVARHALPAPDRLPREGRGCSRCRARRADREARSARSRCAAASPTARRSASPARRCGNDHLLGLFVEGTRQLQRPSRQGDAGRRDDRHAGGRARRARGDLRLAIAGSPTVAGAGLDRLGRADALRRTCRRTPRATSRRRPRSRPRSCASGSCSREMHALGRPDGVPAAPRRAARRAG